MKTTFLAAGAMALACTASPVLAKKDKDEIKIEQAIAKITAPAMARAWPNHT